MQDKKEEMERLRNSILRKNIIAQCEAEKQHQPLYKLPTDRDGLVTAYTQLFGDESEGRYHTAETDKISFVEGCKIPRNTRQPITKRSRTERAEIFVDSKRERIKSLLIKIMKVEICLSLALDSDEDTIDAIPYLRAYLIENGYKKGSRTLSTKDETAIDKAAQHYLNLLELAFLNGIGKEKNEEFKSLRDKNGAFKETYLYKDLYDEALLEFETMYELLTMSITEAYKDVSPKAITELIRAIYRGYMTDKEAGLSAIKDTKFAPYLRKENLC